jgi:hypothetical protein
MGAAKDERAPRIVDFGWRLTGFFAELDGNVWTWDLQSSDVGVVLVLIQLSNVGVGI